MDNEWVWLVRESVFEGVFPQAPLGPWTEAINAVVLLSREKVNPGPKGHVCNDVIMIGSMSCSRVCAIAGICILLSPIPSGSVGPLAGVLHGTEELEKWWCWIFNPIGPVCLSG